MPRCWAQTMPTSLETVVTTAWAQTLVRILLTADRALMSFSFKETVTNTPYRATLQTSVPCKTAKAIAMELQLRQVSSIWLSETETTTLLLALVQLWSPRLQLDVGSFWIFQRPSALLRHRLPPQRQRLQPQRLLPKHKRHLRVQEVQPSITSK